MLYVVEVGLWCQSLNLSDLLPGFTQMAILESLNERLGKNMRKEIDDHEVSYVNCTLIKSAKTRQFFREQSYKITEGV